MRYIICLLFLIIFICFNSCGPVVNYSKLTDDSFPPKPKGTPIGIFMSKTPTCPYEEIGIVNVSEGAFSGGMETFIEAMKVKARKWGGDAIILSDLGTRTSGYIELTPGVVGAAESKTQTGIIIKFTNPECID